MSDLLVTSAISPFAPDRGTIEEFLQRFEVQMSDCFGRNNQNKLRCLVKVLPPEIVVTVIQRRLAPISLLHADYDNVEKIFLE